MVQYPDIKPCRSCKEEKSLDQFYKRTKSKDGYDGQCKKCKEDEKREWRKNNPDKVKAQRRRNREKNLDYYNKKVQEYNKANPMAYLNTRMKPYGITGEEYLVLLEKQDNKCAICSQDLPEDSKHIHLDHCHDTLKVRGILCRSCNLGLGNFKDDIVKLQSAIEYLRK